MHRYEKEAEQKRLRYFFASSACFKDLLRNNLFCRNLKILAATVSLVLVVALRLPASPCSLPRGKFARLFRLKFLNFVTKNYYPIDLKQAKSSIPRFALEKFGFIRHAVYAGLIFTVAFSLSGCALIGLLLRLAPLAAIMVEYSPPVQTEDEQIICVKYLRYVEQNGEDTRIVKSEYFLVVLDAQGTEIASEPLEVGPEYFLTESFSIEKNDKNIFTLYFANEKIARKWKFEVERQTLLFLAESNLLLASFVA